MQCAPVRNYRMHLAADAVEKPTAHTQALRLQPARKLLQFVVGDCGITLDEHVQRNEKWVATDLEDLSRTDVFADCGEGKP